MPESSILASDLTLPPRHTAMSNAPEPSTYLRSKICLVWEEATGVFESMLTKEKIKNHDPVSFIDLLNDARGAKDTAESKQRPFAQSICKIFEIINEHAVDDIIVQLNAKYTTSAWGSIRFLLLLAVAEESTTSKLVDSLELAVSIVFRAQKYARFLLTAEELAGKVLSMLHKNIVHLYAHVLSFLVRARVFFDQPKVVRMFHAKFGPFEGKFQDVIGKIGVYEESIRKDIELLNTEKEKMAQEKYDNDTWLRHADFEQDFEKLRKQHLDGTGQWFLENKMLRVWREESSNSCLWLQGKAGTGKSTLAGLLVERLSSQSTVIRVFCKTGVELKSDLISILRNIIFQLLQHSKGSRTRELHKIIKIFRSRSDSPFARSMEDLWSILKRFLNCAPTLTFCVIDALDECIDSHTAVADFFSCFTKIVNSAPEGFKTLVISRPELGPPVIGNDSWRRLRIDTPDVRDDIRHFVTVKLNECHQYRNHDSEWKENLVRLVTDASEGMMLYAFLVFSEVENGYRTVESFLKKPSTGLAPLYGSILRRFAKDSTLTDPRLHVLRFVLAAARPLNTSEINLVVGILVGVADDKDIHEVYRSTGGDQIVRQLSPLLESMPNGTVQLVHSSLKDFLLEPNRAMATREPIPPLFLFDQSHLHESIASALVSYLSLECFREDTTGGDQTKVQQKYPLLEYASTNFIWHLTQARTLQERTVDILAGFFPSTQGWRWLQRMLEQYGLSCGHLQVLQSQLNEWMESINDGAAGKFKRAGLNTFLVCLNERIADETERLFGACHARTLGALENFASACDIQGQTEKALKLQRRLFEARTMELGEHDPNTLRALEGLAQISGELGRWEDAKNFNLKALEGRKKLLQSDRQGILHVMGSLAWAYSELGRWEKAQDIIERASAAQSTVPEEDRSDTFKIILAWEHIRQNRWQDAEKLDLEVLNGRKKTLGDGHPDTLKAMANLASTYSESERWKCAERLHSDVLNARTRLLGDDHRDTLKAIAILAETYGEMKRWEEAEQLQIRLVASREKVLGDDHPDTLKALGNLGWVYGAKHRWEDTMHVDLVVLDGRRRRLRAGHPDTLFTMENLAREYGEMGRWEEAEKIQLEVVQGRKKEFGDDHLQTFRALAALQWIYRGLERWEDAKRLKPQILNGCKKVLGQDHPDIRKLQDQPFGGSTGNEWPELSFTSWLQERTIVRAL